MERRREEEPINLPVEVGVSHVPVNLCDPFYLEALLTMADPAANEAIKGMASFHFKKFS